MSTGSASLLVLVQTATDFWRHRGFCFARRAACSLSARRTLSKRRRRSQRYCRFNAQQNWHSNRSRAEESRPEARDGRLMRLLVSGWDSPQEVSALSARVKVRVSLVAPWMQWIAYAALSSACRRRIPLMVAGNPA